MKRMGAKTSRMRITARSSSSQQSRNSNPTQTRKPDDQNEDSAKLALELLRGEGILATPGSAPYAGQTGVWVFGDERVQRKAKRILYSY